MNLSEENMETFYHIVAKLLYVSKTARVDIYLVVSLSCTKVSKSTKEDWGKFRCLLHYLHTTLSMPKIIGADGMNAM